MITDAVLFRKFERKKYLSWKQIDYYSVSLVIRDVILGLPSQPVALCLDQNVGKNLKNKLRSSESGI